MTPSLKISQKLLDRLFESSVVNKSGNLHGIFVKNNLTVLGLTIDFENINEDDLSYSFPTEVYICGLIEITEETVDEQASKKKLNHIEFTDNPVLLHYNPTTKQLFTYFYINDKLETSNFVPISHQEIQNEFLYIRLQAQLPLSAEFTNDAIREAFLQLRRIVASGIMAFKLCKNDIYLLGSDDENSVVGITGNPSIGEFCEVFVLTEGSKKKKKQRNCDIDVVYVQMLKLVTKEVGTKHAPLCILDKKQCKTLNLVAKIDGLAMLHRETKTLNLYEILVETATKYLRLYENILLKNMNEELSEPETFHFYPESLGHFVTKLYLKNQTDVYLQKERQILHNQFLLSVTYPQFRRANDFCFKSDNPVTGPLINVHEGVKLTDNNGKIVLVKGKYQYYHYCQDKEDDNGWGCAYRSLQTLASWFKLQGYTECNVPTFEQIQKSLVTIGDKPNSFLGSKQWIGSTEVNFVLNHLFGVTCKILYVSSGEEMAMKGQELLRHFEVNGTPVMIGGGVLAHTILGVDYNSQTGDLKFLILDPHYTGPDDSQIIQTKGWCGWKGVNFWDKSSYYNMCLPQAPKEV